MSENEEQPVEENAKLRLRRLRTDSRVSNRPGSHSGYPDQFDNRSRQHHVKAQRLA